MLKVIVITILQCVALLAAVPSLCHSQAKQSFVVETAGGYGDDALAMLSLGYGKRWNDSFSYRISTHWLHSDLQSTVKGALGGDARVLYTLDFLSIIPSVFIGIGGGYDFSGKASYVILQYGIQADYMQSRRFHWGLSLGGLVVSGASEDEQGDPVMKTGWYVGLRLKWIIGEEW
ncbi:hypothetical protein KKF84_01390 [Myxococcota bacterium]|nr:hypothetical protein [Myxococcota bacterium]